MGQYYIAVNLDKKQYLHPHRFDDGMKLAEFSMTDGRTMTALALLLADGNGRGGGDVRPEHELIGSWAGDRIVIAGDYADKGKFVDNPEEKVILDDDEPDDEPRTLGELNIATIAMGKWEDISYSVRSVMEAAEMYEGR